MGRSDFIFKYRVRNWPEYNKVLISRGSLTLWVDEQGVPARRRQGTPQGRGRPQIYTEAPIECALVVRTVFRLSLRVTLGFLESVVRLMGVDLPMPAYSTSPILRRRAKATFYASACRMSARTGRTSNRQRPVNARCSTWNQSFVLCLEKFVTYVGE